MPNLGAKQILRKCAKLPLFVLAVPIVVVIRLLKPLILIRLGALVSQRLGHFAANTELYLCERAAGIGIPKQRHADIFFLIEPVSNQQLARMWRRLLRIWPAWIVSPVRRVNAAVPGGAVHDIGQNTQWDRDVHNLLDETPPWLQFNAEEQERGEQCLRKMGIPADAPIVCLMVRDSAYLEAHIPSVDWSYHNYRDSDIQNYVLAAEALATRGYYVIRMGAKVRDAIKSDHPKVIDYALNGMRSDFMDIYLGAKCEFCISVGSGFDAVPYIFRRPIAFVNHVPLGYLVTYGSQFIGITKHHFLAAQGRCLTLAEIFSYALGFPNDGAEYRKRGVLLVENSPEEIRDVAIEMLERLNGTWQPRNDDEVLQKSFWRTFQVNATLHGKPMHGEIRSRYGAAFLRNNRWWLEAPSSKDIRGDSPSRPRSSTN